MNHIFLHMRFRQKLSVVVTVLTALFYAYKKGFSHGRKVEEKRHSAGEVTQRVTEEAPSLRQ